MPGIFLRNYPSVFFNELLLHIRTLARSFELQGLEDVPASSFQYTLKYKSVDDSRCVWKVGWECGMESCVVMMVVYVYKRAGMEHSNLEQCTASLFN